MTAAVGRPLRDRGSTTVEVAILAPLLLVVIFTVVQVGTWSYARSLALGAAQEGLNAARVEGGTLAAGRLRAEEFLDRTAGESLQRRVVEASASTTQVEVVVRGRALSVLPGVPGLPVRQSAHGPIERVTLP